MFKLVAVGAVLCAIAATAIGCGERLESKCANNASGVVKVAGVPTAGVYIYLHSLENMQAAVLGAKTSENGVFVIPVAAPGEYAITASWPKVTLDHGEEIEGEDRFQAKYASPARPVVKVTIQAGENSLPPIDLKR